MCNLSKRMRLASFLLLICTLLVPWSGVSCRSSLNGGRKVLGSIAASTSQINFEQTLSTPSSVCRTTGNCKEVISASKMPPSFHRSLSAAPLEDACLDSPRPILLAERHLIPPFAPSPFCSNEVKAQLQNLSRNATISRLKHQVVIDDAIALNRTVTCSNFSINSLDKHNETLLHDAAWHNSSRSCKVLCELEIDTEVRNRKGKTALLVAANRTSFEALEVLLNCNVNVNAVDNKGRTALHFAAIQNSSKIAKALCERTQISLEAQNDEGRTALIISAKKKSFDTLKVITTHNANVNAQDNRNRTALYYAVKNCDTKITQFLVQNRADPSIKDNKGTTPLDLISKSPNACDKEALEELRALLSPSAIKQS